MKDSELDKLLQMRASPEAPAHMAHQIIHKALTSQPEYNWYGIVADVLGFKPAIALALTLVLGLAIGTNLPQETLNNTTELSDFYQEIDEDIYL